MKKQKGISLIALIVTIIVIIILASIVMSGGLNSVKEARDTKVDMELRNLKDAVSERMIKNAENAVGYPLVGEKIDDAAEYIYYIDGITNAEIEEFIQELSEENIDWYRIVDAKAAEKLGVDAIDEEHYFLVDYSSGKVYGTINMKAVNEE